MSGAARRGDGGASEVLAPRKPSLVVLAAVASAVVFLGVSIDGLRGDTFLDYLRLLPLSVAVSVGVYLLCTGRIVAQGGTLEVVNVVVVWQIGRGNVERIDVENGVFVVAGGRRIDCFAWGPSLLQEFVTTRRMRRLQDALRAWERQRGDADPTGVSRRVRPDLLAAVGVVGLTTGVLALSLWLARDALLPIIGA